MTLDYFVKDRANKIETFEENYGNVTGTTLDEAKLAFNALKHGLEMNALVMIVERLENIDKTLKELKPEPTYVYTDDPTGNKKGDYY